MLQPLKYLVVMIVEFKMRLGHFFKILSLLLSVVWNSSNAAHKAYSRRLGNVGILVLLTFIGL